MTQYHRLYVPRALWEDLTTRSQAIPGKKPSDYALDCLRNPIQTYELPKNPFKTSVAPKEIKKIDTTGRKGKKFLYHVLELGVTNWMYRSDDEDLYDTYFYFCESRGMLTDDKYGPLFRSDRYTDFSSDNIDLAKCLIIERNQYLKKLNVPRETKEKDFTEYDEAVKKREEKMDELKEG